jgi:hypothetical protein
MTTEIDIIEELKKDNPNIIKYVDNIFINLTKHCYNNKIENIDENVKKKIEYMKESITNYNYLKYNESYKKLYLFSLWSIGLQSLFKRIVYLKDKSDILYLEGYVSNKRIFYKHKEKLDQELNTEFLTKESILLNNINEIEKNHNRLDKIYENNILDINDIKKIAYKMKSNNKEFNMFIFYLSNELLIFSDILLYLDNNIPDISNIILRYDEYFKKIIKYINDLNSNIAVYELFKKFYVFNKSLLKDNIMSFILNIIIELDKDLYFEIILENIFNLDIKDSAKDISLLLKKCFDILETEISGVQSGGVLDIDNITDLDTGIKVLKTNIKKFKKYISEDTKMYIKSKIDLLDNYMLNKDKKDTINDIDIKKSDEDDIDDFLKNSIREQLFQLFNYSKISTTDHILKFMFIISNIDDDNKRQTLLKEMSIIEDELENFISIFFIEIDDEKIKDLINYLDSPFSVLLYNNSQIYKKILKIKENKEYILIYNILRLLYDKCIEDDNKLYYLFNITNINIILKLIQNIYKKLLNIKINKEKYIISIISKVYNEFYDDNIISYLKIIEDNPSNKRFKKKSIPENNNLYLRLGYSIDDEYDKTKENPKDDIRFYNFGKYKNIYEDDKSNKDIADDIFETLKSLKNICIIPFSQNDDDKTTVLLTEQGVLFDMVEKIREETSSNIIVVNIFQVYANHINTLYKKKRGYFIDAFDGKYNITYNYDLFLKNKIKGDFLENVFDNSQIIFKYKDDKWLFINDYYNENNNYITSIDITAKETDYLNKLAKNELDLYSIVKFYLDNYKYTEPTPLNPKSSRSHILITINFIKTDEEINYKINDKDIIKEKIKNPEKRLTYLDLASVEPKYSCDDLFLIDILNKRYLSNSNNIYKIDELPILQYNNYNIKENYDYKTNYDDQDLNMIKCKDIKIVLDISLDIQIYIFHIILYILYYFILLIYYKISKNIKDKTKFDSSFNKLFKVVDIESEIKILKINKNFFMMLLADDYDDSIEQIIDNIESVDDKDIKGTMQMIFKRILLKNNISYIENEIDILFDYIEDNEKYLDNTSVILQTYIDFSKKFNIDNSEFSLLFIKDKIINIIKRCKKLTDIECHNNKIKVLKTNCMNRVVEGKFLNETIKDMINLLQISYRKDYKYLYFGYDIWYNCRNTNLNNQKNYYFDYSSISNVGILYELIKKFHNDELLNIKYIILTIINISENTNNPPLIPYINELKELQLLLDILENKSIDNLSKFIELFNIIEQLVFDLYNKIHNKIFNKKIIEYNIFLGTIITFYKFYENNNTLKKSELSKQSRLDNLKLFIENINLITRNTLIGTLEDTNDIVDIHKNRCVAYNSKILETKNLYEKYLKHFYKIGYNIKPLIEQNFTVEEDNFIGEYKKYIKPTDKLNIPFEEDDTKALESEVEEVEEAEEAEVEEAEEEEVEEDDKTDTLSEAEPSSSTGKKSVKKLKKKTDDEIELIIKEFLKDIHQHFKDLATKDKKLNIPTDGPYDKISLSGIYTTYRLTFNIFNKNLNKDINKTYIKNSEKPKLKKSLVEDIEKLSRLSSTFPYTQKITTQYINNKIDEILFSELVVKSKS